MNVSVTGRHMSVTDAMKDYAVEKANRLERYYDQIQHIEVIIDNAGDRRQVEMIIRARVGGKFVGTVEHEDAYAAIDLLLDKMERQLTKQKEKLKLKKRSGESNRVGAELEEAAQAATAESEAELESYQEVVDKTEIPKAK